MYKGITFVIHKEKKHCSPKSNTMRLRAIIPFDPKDYTVIKNWAIKEGLITGKFGEILNPVIARRTANEWRVIKPYDPTEGKFMIFVHRGQPIGILDKGKFEEWNGQYDIPVPYPFYIEHVDNGVFLDAPIFRETEKALCFEIEGEKIWFPKSQIKKVDDGRYFIPDWLASNELDWIGFVPFATNPIESEEE
ncbi:MAG: hypothetical protein D6698_17645 [Gammaproteobacteria bacterium]|nr:MAG: hypothetical protein D6698_17645 [Gammaproteobacteria bacterium]